MSAQWSELIMISCILSKPQMAEEEVQQVEVDFTDHGLTPSPQVWAEKVQNDIGSSEKPVTGSSEPQPLQDNGK